VTIFDAGNDNRIIFDVASSYRPIFAHFSVVTPEKHVLLINGSIFDPDADNINFQGYYALDPRGNLTGPVYRQIRGHGRPGHNAVVYMLELGILYI
jgi:hypothetical protein